mmetsp:Transcript_21711/g.24976  ORF Transcript_21711/g.24976 Transcript_21711/m.24976 type:complete len:289 (-) Transcript_21711:80-946(-)
MEFNIKRERTFSEGYKKNDRIKEFGLRLAKLKPENKFNPFNQQNLMNRLSPEKRSRYEELPMITSQKNLGEPNSCVLNQKKERYGDYQKPELSTIVNDFRGRSKKYIEMPSESNSQSSVSPVNKLSRRMNKDVFSPQPKQKLSLVQPKNGISNNDLKLLQRLVHMKVSQVNGVISFKSNSPIKRHRISIKKKREKPAHCKKQFVLKISKQNGNPVPVVSATLKQKVHQRRKIRKVTSNVFEPDRDKLNSQLFSLENFGDASGRVIKSSKKCNMDLSQFVSDKELEEMK